MKIFNDLTGRKEEFVPLEEKRVRFYVCGPTVYNFIHIGNARPYVLFDCARRYLEFLGYSVSYAQNFTDIDDKIINRANEEGASINDITEKYINEFFTDADGLNIKRATFYPRATAEIPGIIDMIETLLAKGFAYAGADGSIYFEAEKFADYGKLSGKNLSELRAGARVAFESAKRGGSDFVLWKPAKPGEPAWEAPWGLGRPGWHIECSVMSKRYLGDTIDIHAGGEDLIFPHHENEIAQSEAANGVPFARYWLHNGMLTMDDKKMAKSAGNFFTVRDLANTYGYDALRLYLVSGHYRSPLAFKDELLRSAESSLRKIRNAYADLSFALKQPRDEALSEAERGLLDGRAASLSASFFGSMDDDFNTANAVSAIYEHINLSCELVSERSSSAFVRALLDALTQFCDILGIKYAAAGSISEEEISVLLAERQTAKTAKDFAEADRIRGELLSRGVEIKDTREGTTWFFR